MGEGGVAGPLHVIFSINHGLKESFDTVPSPGMGVVYSWTSGTPLLGVVGRLWMGVGLWPSSTPMGIRNFLEDWRPVWRIVGSGPPRP